MEREAEAIATSEEEEKEEEEEEKEEAKKEEKEVGTEDTLHHDKKTPWQYDWKNPVISKIQHDSISNEPQHHNQNESNAIPSYSHNDRLEIISQAAAQLSEDEYNELLPQKLGNTENNQRNNTHGIATSSKSYMMQGCLNKNQSEITLTLLTTTKTNQRENVKSIIEFKHSLLWPNSIFSDKSSSKLISLSFFRYSSSKKSNNDIVLKQLLQDLSLEQNISNDYFISSNVANNRSEKLSRKENQELVLVLLDSNMKFYFYKVSVLIPKSATCAKEDEWFFGSASLVSFLQEKISPLSNPFHVLALSCNNFICMNIVFSYLVVASMDNIIFVSLQGLIHEVKRIKISDFDISSIVPVCWNGMLCCLIHERTYKNEGNSIFLIRVDEGKNDKITVEIISKKYENIKNLRLKCFKLIPITVPILLQKNETSFIGSSCHHMKEHMISTPGIIIYAKQQVKLFLFEKLTYFIDENLVKLETLHHSRHTASINENSIEKFWSTGDTQHGSSWSICQVNKNSYFIIWEGATSQAYIEKLNDSSIDNSFAMIVSLPTSSSVEVQDEDDNVKEEELTPKTTNASSPPSFLFKQGSLISFKPIDKLQNVLNSMKEISDMNTGSAQLLKHCSTWRELHNVHHDITIQHQESLIVLSNNIFSLRCQSLVYSNIKTILNWMIQLEENYTCAISIVLLLLHDFESLRYLRTQYEGLLDGIIVNENSMKHRRMILSNIVIACCIKGYNTNELYHETLMGFLARNFEYYDAFQVCLMFVSTTASLVMECSQKKDNNENLVVEDYLWPVQCLMVVATHRDMMDVALKLLNSILYRELRREYGCSEELCDLMLIIIISSSPNASSELLSLVNENGVTYWDTLEYEAKLAISLLSVEYSEIIHNINEENDALEERVFQYPFLVQPQVRTWILDLLNQHIIDPNESENALPSSWISDLCIACFSNSNCHWRDLLHNKESIYESLAMELSSSLTSQLDHEQIDEKKDDDNESDEYNDNLLEYRSQVKKIRNALSHPISEDNKSLLIDFNIILSSLLLLQNRQITSWTLNSSISTQSLLSQACYYAGKPLSYSQDNEKNMVAATAMKFIPSMALKQCAISNNVIAVGNMIGGKHGFLLKCSHVLVSYAGFAIEDALANIQYHFSTESNNKNDVIDQVNSSGNEYTLFKLTDGFREIIWLIDEHILQISKFADFVIEDSLRDIKLDPVFAARSCLITWLLLVRNVAQQHKENHETYFREATIFLMSWLREHLDIRLEKNDLYRAREHRLACSAFIRALLWNSDENDSYDGSEVVLAEKLAFNSMFLLELGHSCSGLVEALPKDMAVRVMKKVHANKHETDDGVVGFDFFSSTVLT